MDYKQFSRSENSLQTRTNEEYDLQFLLQTQNQHDRKAILNQSTPLTK